MAWWKYHCTGPPKILEVRRSIRKSKRTKKKTCCWLGWQLFFLVWFWETQKEMWIRGQMCCDKIDARHDFLAPTLPCQDGVQIFPDPNRIAEIQQLMTDTWLPHFSRDRRLIHGSAAVPVGCRVANVLRVENHRAYARYSSYKDGLKMKRPGPCTPFPVRTSNRINLLEDDARLDQDFWSMVQIVPMKKWKLSGCGGVQWYEIK